MNTHIIYRPDIDGLRAIAILSVIIFHAFPNVIGGGFIGVDIFFVISGYLITTILLGDLQNDRFSFKIFYARRIRRLFPALATVLIVTLSVGWFILLPKEFAALGKHTAAGIGFVANFTLLRETGYFDVAAETKPLLHLWSLGIEEQFYIFWPMILLGAWKIRRGFWLIAVFVFLMSFIYCVIETYDDPDDAFFLPYSRFWELLSGAFLAKIAAHKKGGFGFSVWEEKNKILQAAKISELAPIIGLALIGLALATYGETTHFPGWLALAPVAGAALLIASQGSFVNRIILSHPVMVWIGLISYPLYLWHWPIMSYMHIIWGEGLGVGSMVSALVASIALAWLTYRYIEMPVRSQPMRKYIRYLCILAAVTFVTGFAVHKGGVRPYIDIPALNNILSSNEDWKYTSSEMEEWRDGKLRFYRLRSKHREEVLYIGDSNMEQFLPRITQLVQEKPEKAYTAVYITRGGCLPIQGVTRHDRPECEKIMGHVRDYIREHNVIRIVIAGIWAAMFDEDKGLTYRFEDGRLVPMTQQEARHAVFQSISQMIHEIRDAGIEVTLIGTIPLHVKLMNGPVLDRLELLRVRRGETTLSIAPDFALNEGINEEVAASIRAAAQAAGADYIDPTAYLCPDGRCPLYQDNHNGIYKDESHITASYAREHAIFMDKTILIGE